MKDAPIVIAGGGPAGLFAARRLVMSGRPVTIVEREPVVGGLSASLRFRGNVYGHGFHALHDRDPGFLEIFKDLAGDDAREFPRSVAIRLRGRFHDYPLSAAGVWRGFTLPELASGLAGFLGACARSPFRRGDARNAEEAVVRIYGRSLYRTYFAEYTDRFWGIPASRISARFAEERLPKFDPAERLRRAFGRWGGGRDGEAARLTEIGRPIMLTTASGTGAFFEALADDLRRRGATVRTGLEVEEAFLEGGRVVGVRARSGDKTEDLLCGALISTLSPGALIHRLRPRPPADVLAAASGLRHRGLLTVGLLVARPRILSRGLVYFHGRAFHRVSEPKVAGVNVAPEDHTVLLAERTADPGEQAWRDREGLVDAVIGDLEIEGLFGAKEVREVRVEAAAEAYPLYLAGFEPRLRAVRDYLARIPNLVSTGRQGRFSFLRSAEAMRAAWSDTEAVLRPGG